MERNTKKYNEALEEAAEEYASINCDDYVDYDSNICFIEEGMRVAFKAGAEWQRRHDMPDVASENIKRRTRNDRQRDNKGRDREAN